MQPNYRIEKKWVKFISFKIVYGCVNENIPQRFVIFPFPIKSENLKTKLKLSEESGRKRVWTRNFLQLILWIFSSNFYVCQVREQFRRIPYQTYWMLELIQLSRFIAPEKNKNRFYGLSFTIQNSLYAFNYWRSDSCEFQHTFRKEFSFPRNVLRQSFT